MALPLLLGIGAGILGGTQYLMKKQDERATASMMDQFLSGAAQTPYGAAYAPQIAQMVQGDDRGFFDANQAGRTRSLLDAFAAQERDFTMNQFARQQEMQDAYSQSNLGIAQNLEQGYNEALRNFAEVQTQFRAAMTALENPSNLNSVTTLYNLFNILEPGGRVTQNEDGTFSGVGDAGNRVSNWLNEWRGEGLTERTRKEIADAIWAQYTPRLEQSRQIKQYYENELNALGAAGRNVRSPVGSLGINFGLQQMPDFGTPGTEPPPPPGFSVVQ